DNTYKDVTEDAVTVKFKVKHPAAHGLPENTYLLAWTTTPWTLPGNVALAVGPDIDYVALTQEGSNQTYLASRDFHARGGNSPELQLTAPTAGGTIKGAALVGLEYEPVYEIEKVKRDASEKKWTVLPADFVNTEEGTGIVHTAVIYGEDDFNL